MERACFHEVDSEAIDLTNFEQLLNQHRSLITRTAQKYFAPGADRSDIVQEATIGFYKAIRDYSPALGTFRAFAILCIQRQVVTYIKSALRRKHMSLNHAQSLDSPLGEDSSRTLLDLLDKGPNFDLTQDFGALILQVLRRCSPFEVKVILLYALGYTFLDIAAELNTTYKSVDNAIWRVKKKARRLAPEGLPAGSDEGKAKLAAQCAR